MEIIKKKISLYPFRSHINGVLPFVGGNGGSNFGEFVYDNTEMRTCERMRRYNVLLEIMRHSVHLKRLSNVNDCGKDSDRVYNKYYLGFRYSDTTEHFIMNEDIGVYIVSAFTLSDDGKYYTSNDNDVSHEYVVLVSENDWDRYEGYGGLDWLRETNETIYTNASGKRFDKTPYIPVPVLLTREYADVGLMTDYFGWLDDKVFSSNNSKDWFDINISGLTTSGTGFGVESSGLTEDKIIDVSNEGIVLESKLNTLKDTQYFSDDDGNILPGIFMDFDGDGQFYKCVYSNGGWDISEYNTRDLECADDEENTVNKKKYKVLTTIEVVKSYLDTVALNGGDTYYFLVRYNNSEDTPMRIPYTEKTVFNGDGYNGVYSGDFIKEIQENGNKVTFTYVIGAIFNSDAYDIETARGGTIYKETYNYYPNRVATAKIDGFEVNYWYNEIDFETQKTYVYSDDFNLSRQTLVSDIQQIKTGDVWEYDGNCLNTPVFKEDYLMGISMDSNLNIDIEVDRGNAAAFERHFVLGECNTMRDLEEYANGSFFE